MKTCFVGLSVLGLLLTTTAMFAAADDAKDEAIKKDRKQIEGTWRVVALEVNGDKVMEEDAKKLTVVNGSDGTWSLRSEGKEQSKGTSTIDPTKMPKTIDFTVEDGVVTYDGFVHSDGEETAARVAAESIPGVRGVDDRRVDWRSFPAMY